MKYFIGIIPPENIFNTILNIQQQFGDNRLEPHITLRSPVTPVDASNWLDSIKKVTASFAPFDIHLPATGYFGKRVLFIKVQSADLKQLYKQVVTAIKPFEPVVKEDHYDYHPHLTLGRSWCGFTRHDFEKMQEMADQYLSVKPVSFNVDFLRVYQKPQGNKRYEKLVDLSLG